MNTSSPAETLKAFQAFAEKHSLGYVLADSFDDPRLAGPRWGASIILSNWLAVPVNLRQWLKSSGHCLEYPSEWIVVGSHYKLAYLPDLADLEWLEL